MSDHHKYNPKIRIIDIDVIVERGDAKVIQALKDRLLKT
jgi:hypothetical protein